MGCGQMMMSPRKRWSKSGPFQRARVHTINFGLFLRVTMMNCVVVHFSLVLSGGHGFHGLTVWAPATNVHAVGPQVQFLFIVFFIPIFIAIIRSHFLRPLFFITRTQKRD